MGLIDKTLKHVDPGVLARNHARAARSKQNAHNKEMQEKMEQCKRDAESERILEDTLRLARSFSSFTRELERWELDD